MAIGEPPKTEGEKPEGENTDKLEDMIKELSSE